MASDVTKLCQACKNPFVIDTEDFAFYEKIQVPPPTFCPQCRMIRRLIFWNERYFFKKLERRTGKTIFSMYPPESFIEIYDRDYWLSDAWDPLSYGKQIDWNRPFLEQFNELQRAVPRSARAISNAVNSEYSNNAADLKNCYLCFNADVSEDCMYCVGINGLKRCISVFRADFSEMLYETYAAFNSYQCFFSSICVDNRNVWLSYDCHDCSDCFGCVNLRHAKYQIFNQQYTKEEYEKRLAAMNLGSYASLEKYQKQFAEFYLKFPRRYMAGLRCVNSSGDAMRNSKNANYSFALNACENVKYSQSIMMGAKDCYDYTNWGNNVELAYETRSCGSGVSRVKFSDECIENSSDIEYSMMCSGSTNLFGCVGLRKKQYCILNKQYSKEEYEQLLPRIKKHMMEMPYVDGGGRVYAYGEFFPPDFSPYAVTESAVLDFVAITKEQALQLGLMWREAPAVEYGITMKALDLPDHIKEVTDDILKQVIGCLSCNKGFKLPPAELQFLRQFQLPLPRKCPNCRVRDLILRRNFPKWHQGKCQCAGTTSSNGSYLNIGKHAHAGAACSETFLTSYAPDRPEIVYCEQCYQQEVI